MLAGDCMRYVLILLFLCSCSIPGAAAGENDKIFKIAENVYARIASPNGNAGGNAGFVIMDHSVVVFDTHFTPEEGKQLLDEIRTVTTLPVRYVINSHYHPDHTHGNKIFADSHVIGSQKTRHGVLQDDLPSLNRSIRIATEQLERMREERKGLRNSEKIESIDENIETRAAYLEELQKLQIVPPFVVLDEYLAIRDGNVEIQILCMGPGHSGGDTVLYIPSVKTVFCGSLFFNLVIPNVRDAKITQWIDVLERILEFDADIYIPGHGPPGSKRDVRECLNYFQDLRAVVGTFVSSGQSLEQAMQETQLPVKYQNYRFKYLFPSNVQRMYEELKEELLFSIPIEGPQLPQN